MLGRLSTAGVGRNRRYLDALAVVDDPAPAYHQLHQLTEPKVIEGRSYAGFNSARRQDVWLFMTVLEGDHIARGFRNADIRERLFGNPSQTRLQRRASAAVGRLLKRLHVRHLVAKVPRTRRWKAPNVVGTCSVWRFNCIAPPGPNSQPSRPLPSRKLLRTLQRSSGERIQSHRLDIRDAEGTKRLVDQVRPDAIVHPAARAGVRPSIDNPVLYTDVNVLGTVHWLEATARLDPSPAVRLRVELERL